MADQSKVLAHVKLRLHLGGDLDELIESYVDEIGDRIRHYCNIDEIPQALEKTWASMVIDAARIDLPNIAEIADTVGGAESVKVGDTQVTPARGSGEVSNTSKEVIDKVVLNYRIDLNRYRKLRW